MRDVDGILDFLEEYELLRPPPGDAGDDPRTGRVREDEQILQVDWEYLISPEIDLGDTGDNPNLSREADLLGVLGIARSPGDLERLRRQAVPPPWDRCAWYAPMHFYGSAWGVYIREDCMRSIAAEIAWFAWDSPRTPATAHHLLKAAFFALFLHEHFHHKVEGFGIRLALADRSSPDHYVRYDSSVYRPSFGTDDNLEEALANADAYRRLDHAPYKRALPAKIRTALRRWMTWRFEHVDPPGYRMAQHYLTPAAFTAGAELLQTQLWEASLRPVSNPEHWQAGPNLLRSVFPINADIYLVIPAGSTTAFPVTGRPYTVPVKKVEQWLTRNGFTKLPGRGKGDHAVFKRADGVQVGLDGGARELSRQIERTIAQAFGVPQRTLREAVSQGRPL